MRDCRNGTPKCNSLYHMSFGNDRNYQENVSKIKTLYRDFLGGRWYSIKGTGWLRLIGSFKSQVSFAKEPHKRDLYSPKKPMILRSLLIVATPYPALLSVFCDSCVCVSKHVLESVCCLYVKQRQYVCACVLVCNCVCMYRCVYVDVCGCVVTCICGCVVTCTNKTTKIADFHDLISQVGACKS